METSDDESCEEQVVVFLGERKFVYNLLKVEDSQREFPSNRFTPRLFTTFHNFDDEMTFSDFANRRIVGL